LVVLGLITCQWCDDQENECPNNACWWDEAPPKSATACDFWCDEHCPKDLPADINGRSWNRLKFKQDLTLLGDGSSIWYPSFWIDNQWRGWGKDK
jgi:hypothetical protein